MADAAEVPKEEEAKPVRAAAPRAQPAPRASTGTPRRQQRTLPSVAQTKTDASCNSARLPLPVLASPAPPGGVAEHLCACAYWIAPTRPETRQVH